MSDVNRNKEVIRRVIDQIFNQGNMDVIDELYAPDYFDHSLAHAQLFGISPDREGFKQLARAVRSGLSDLKAELEVVVAEGDFVAARMHGVGMHTGLFMNVPSTGKRIDVFDYHFFRMENGKIREHWNQYNTLEIMQQLGVIPRA